MNFFGLLVFVSFFFFVGPNFLSFQDDEVFQLISTPEYKRCNDVTTADLVRLPTCVLKDMSVGLIICFGFLLHIKTRHSLLIFRDP